MNPLQMKRSNPGKPTKKKSLKVYHLPNWDGTYAAIVAALTQKEACKILEISEYSFRLFGGEKTRMSSPMWNIAMSRPGVVFKRKITEFNATWEAVNG